MANDIEIHVNGVNDFGRTSAAIQRSLASITRSATKATAALAMAMGTTTTMADRATDATDRLSDNLNAIGARSKRVKVTSDTVGQVGDTARRATPAVAALGDELAEIGGDSDRLARALDQVKERHAALLRQLDTTGDRELIPKIKADQASIAALTKMKRQLADAYDVGVGGTGELIEDIGENIAKGARSPYMLAAGAALAAALSPAIGAGIAAGVLGGAGIGGLAAGIAGAARSQEVAAEIVALGDRLSSELTMIGVDFRAPVAAGLAQLRQELNQLDLAGILAPLAKTIEPITKGLLGMVREAAPGLRQMFAAAAPLISDVANQLPAIGRAIGDFADSIAAAGPGARAFFGDLIRATTAFVDGAGETIEALSKIYDKLSAFNELTGGGLEDMLLGVFGQMGSALSDVIDAMTGGGTEKILRGVGEGGASAANGLSAMAQSAEDLAEAEKKARQATNDLHDALRSQFDAVFSVEEGLDNLRESIDEHGRSMDMTTEKGRANIDILRGLVDAAQAAGQAAYDQAVAEGNTADASYRAAAAQNALINQIRAAAAAMGFNKSQVDALIASLLGLPSGTKTLNYEIIEWHYVRYQGQDAREQARYGSGYAHAAGGWTQPGLNVVGESGPELLWETKPRWVSTAAETGKIMGGGGPSAPSGDGSVVNVYVSALDPRAAADAVMDALTEWTRINGPMPKRLVAT